MKTVSTKPGAVQILETLKGSSATQRDTDEAEDTPESRGPSVDEPTGRTDEDEVSAADLAMAKEIAGFIAERAFEFDDHECRAWALTDFGVWAALAGESAQLSFDPEGSTVHTGAVSTGSSSETAI